MCVLKFNTNLINAKMLIAHLLVCFELKKMAAFEHRCPHFFSVTFHPVLFKLALK